MVHRKGLFLLMVVVGFALVACYEDEEVMSWEEERGSAGGGEGRWEGREEGGTGRREGEERFLLQDSHDVVRTDAGSMRVVRGIGGRIMRNPLHIGFITMEPRSLFIPQYLDSNLVLFIRRGDARLGHIYKDELVEKRLKTGDVYTVEAGSAFYLVNMAEGQRLHVICSIHTTESLGSQMFQSFFIGGGTYPASVLSGFDPLTLSTAFNVSESELRDLLTRQQEGPIVYLSDSRSPSAWTRFLDLEHHQKLGHMRRIVRIAKEDIDKEEEKPTWFFKKFLRSIFGTDNKRDDDRGSSKGPDSYNIYDTDPDFRNNYGWSIALDESDYSPLRNFDIGVYLVNLTAGSMMAPHINPRATEYGVVLRGAGTIQIVYPNGSLAMNAKVTEGDVFWLPRYFPFCQIASRTGPFEFFGFTTSARNNRPQFLVGSNSLLQTMRGPALATAFGVSEERMNEILAAQNESTILPSAAVAPPDMLAVRKKVRGEIPKMIKSFGNDMIMRFD